LQTQTGVIARTDTISSPYISPVDSPLTLTGNFGELRSNHFHSGIDFSTNGSTGQPVYSTADGYVSRIKVSPSGYGKALYINHYDGTTSVYGHLDSFISPVSDFVKEIQYENESFSLDTLLQDSLFHFKQGDIIANSGNSGSSGGPHLHFEIRDTKSERPQNPLKYKFNIKDDMNPPIMSVYLYPLSENSHVNGNKNKYRYKAVYYDGKYHLKNNGNAKVFGDIGIGIEAIDYLNAGWSKCGIYESKLIINNDTIYSFTLDSFSFSHSRYLNAHVDYEERLKKRNWVHKLFKLPGNKLDIYNQTINNGIYNFLNDSTYNIEILVYDAYRNVSKINFTLKGTEIQLPPVTDDFFSRMFIYSRKNYFEADNIRLNIPENALYEDLKFTYDSEQNPEQYLSDVHHIHNKHTPVHKWFSLAIRPDTIPDHLKEKALIVSVNNKNGNKSSAGGSCKDGWVYTRLRNFGSFAVSVDTIPPRIKPLSINGGKILKEKERIRFKIADDLSGIKNFRGEIDGEWVLFEYDAKSNLIFYYFDDDKIKKNTKHQLNLVVEDHKGNRSEYNAVFFR
jgi:hypothetical protein